MTLSGWLPCSPTSLLSILICAFWASKASSYANPLPFIDLDLEGGNTWIYCVCVTWYQDSSPKVTYGMSQKSLCIFSTLCYRLSQLVRNSPRSASSPLQPLEFCRCISITNSNNTPRALCTQHQLSAEFAIPSLSTCIHQHFIHEVAHTGPQHTKAGKAASNHLPKPYALELSLEESFSCRNS